jgi:hypothetical protein
LFRILAALPLLAAPAWADQHEGARPGATGARAARVAGGQTVELAASAKTSQQWAKQRPSYQALIPKKR